MTIHQQSAEPNDSPAEGTAEETRYQRGRRVLDAVDGETRGHVIDALADIAPSLAHHVIDYGFRDVYSGLASPHPNRSWTPSGCSPLSVAANPNLRSTSAPRG